MSFFAFDGFVLQILLTCERKIVQNQKQKLYNMKRIFLAATIAIMLVAGLSTKTQAQTTSANIEVLNADVTTPVKFSETPFYNKAGELLGTVKRYGASGLSKEISMMITNQFPDYTVIGVEEVTIPSEKTRVYYVHIGNDKKLQTVRIANGESEVTDKYRRG